MNTTKSQLHTSKASEKASAALFELVTSSGDLRERLTKAWERKFCDIKEDELPDEFRGQFRKMNGKVSTHGIERDSHGGTIRSSIRHMEEDDVKYWARQLVTFAIEVEIEMSKK